LIKQALATFIPKKSAPARIQSAIEQVLTDERWSLAASRLGLTSGNKTPGNARRCDHERSRSIGRNLTDHAVDGNSLTSPMQERTIDQGAWL
jgi:hypothetical protein